MDRQERDRETWTHRDRQRLTDGQHMKTNRDSEWCKVSGRQSCAPNYNNHNLSQASWLSTHSNTPRACFPWNPNRLAMTQPTRPKTAEQMAKERAFLSRAKLCIHNQSAHGCNPPNGKRCNFAHRLCYLQVPEESAGDWSEIWKKRRG